MDSLACWPREKIYPQFGLRTSPAPADIPEVHALSDALATNDVKDFVARGLAQGVPKAELRLVTTGDFAPGVDSSETRVKDRLSWVLTYSGSPVDFHGGAVGFSPSPEQEKATCDFSIILDAESLEFITATQDC